MQIIHVELVRTHARTHARTHIHLICAATTTTVSASVPPQILLCRALKPPSSPKMLIKSHSQPRGTLSSGGAPNTSTSPSPSFSPSFFSSAWGINFSGLFSWLNMFHLRGRSPQLSLHNYRDTKLHQVAYPMNVLIGKQIDQSNAYYSVTSLYRTPLGPCIERCPPDTDIDVCTLCSLGQQIMSSLERCPLFGVL